MEEKIGAGGEPQTYNPDDGRYTGKGTTYRQNTSYAEILQRSKQSGAISGAQSGALDPSKDKDKKRTEKHAYITYERIRRTKDDVRKVALTSGYSMEEITRIKNHMFFNEYELQGGKHRFDPDFDQAQSWDRLQRGEPIEADLVMLQHEKIEEELMRNGMGYDEAHEIANRTANYSNAIKEYRNAVSKKKGN